MLYYYVNNLEQQMGQRAYYQQAYYRSLKEDNKQFNNIYRQLGAKNQAAHL